MHMPDKEANLEKIIEQLRFINRSSYESLSTLIANNLSIYLSIYLSMQQTENQKSIYVYKKLWAEMVMGRNGMGRNGYGPKWSWAEMVMGRNDPEPAILPQSAPSRPGKHIWSLDIVKRVESKIL